MTAPNGLLCVVKGLHLWLYLLLHYKSILQISFCKPVNLNAQTSFYSLHLLVPHFSIFWIVYFCVTGTAWMVLGNAIKKIWRATMTCFNWFAHLTLVKTSLYIYAKDLYKRFLTVENQATFSLSPLILQLGPDQVIIVKVCSNITFQLKWKFSQFMLFLNGYEVINRH